MIARANIVAAAREWLDVPYIHQHYTRDGCDCLGLVMGVGIELGHLRDYRPPAYSPNPDPIVFRRVCDAIFDPVEGPIEPGMIGVFWYAQRDVSQHMAIFTDHRGLGMIHANHQNGRVREHLIDNFWWRRYIRAYQYRGAA